MTQKSPQLRRQQYSTPEIGELARDTQAALKRFLQQEVRIMDDYYREPMIIGQLEREPAGIELIRVQQVGALEVPVKCGSLVHYTFDAAGARITSIDGLTHTASTKYRFTFRLTFL